MYLLVGYQLMYGGGYLLAGIENDGAEAAADLVTSVLAESQEAGFSGDSVYSNASDFFFHVGLSVVHRCDDWLHLSNGRQLDMGRSVCFRTLLT